MSKYIVTLTPTGKFFFGGEMTFSTGRKEEDKRFSSYIIHSSTMPQQTSLLGMMRFLLLSNDNDLFSREENHIIPGKVNEVDELIGECSFSVPENPQKKGTFGKIEGLGTCFIYNKCNKVSYFKTALDDGLIVDFNLSQEAVLNDVKMEIPEILVEERVVKEDNNLRYSGKDSLVSKYVSADRQFSIKEEDLFKSDSRIGIDKNYEGKTNNSAFYKQISYRLEKDFCFAFTVEMDKSVDLTLYNGQLVMLGGDCSSFIFEAYSIGREETLDIDYPENADAEHRVVLISDAFLPQDILKLTRYAITNIHSFRFLTTKNKTDAKEYNVKHRSLRSPRRYELYQASSVFYFENKKQRDKFCRVVDSFEAFKQIGYNKYY